MYVRISYHSFVLGERINSDLWSHERITYRQFDVVGKRFNIGQAPVSDVKVTSYVQRLRSTFVSPKVSNVTGRSTPQGMLDICWAFIA